MSMEKTHVVKKRRRIIFCVSLLIGMLMLGTLGILFHLSIGKNPLIKNAIERCIREGNCLSAIMKNMASYATGLTYVIDCDSLEQMMKDICVYNKRYDDYDKFVNPLSDTSFCFLIESPYLSKMCLRSNMRPHMLTFMTTPYSNITPPKDFPAVCEDSSPPASSYCMYLLSANYARTNLSRSKALCKNFPDRDMEGECLFYAALGLSYDIPNNLPFSANVSSFCDSIGDRFWRMECHYLIADELSSVATDKPSLEAVRDACHKARMLSSFRCFDHVTFLLPFEKIGEFCTLPMEEYERKECYRGYGKQIFLRYEEDTSKAKQNCEQLVDPYDEECKRGVFIGLALTSSKSERLIINACSVEDEMTSYLCINQFSARVARQCEGTAKECFLSCIEKFPPELRSFCAKGIGYASSFFSGDNIKHTFEKCNSMSSREEDKSSCVLGVGTAIAHLIAENVSIALQSCLSLPQEYQSSCIYGFGREMTAQYYPRVEEIVPTCQNLPTRLAPVCINGSMSTLNLFGSKEVCNHFFGQSKEICLASKP
jgi:hypothetical protein